MPNNIIEIADKDTLEAIKQELQTTGNNPEEILQKFASMHQEKKYESFTCNVNFGHSRNITNFNKTMTNIRPYSNLQNYRKIREARGEWKNIYEIAFGSTETTITAKLAKEKVKQITKEAA